ncbi:MAG: bifunctional pyr operon transcriptional regulator/uracil phosphoribosyltransferase PyrR [Deltaproteobacteria bacterium]|jgi:pyrimidine operon attenuation protein/uracil phosphoribosyltransferase|nr:bifunctional pyr operon transcriptional regulator/uracil phosphoribosyltransferase PyrR [Deltaproteobacteria bacterium]
MAERTILHDSSEVSQALVKMARDIFYRKETLPIFVGIRRGGVVVSNLLQKIIHEKYGVTPSAGVVDINFYRDDWIQARSFPKVGTTEINFSLEDQRVLLVDDVLFTGRTVRAALDALSEFGRASSVELAVLVDRGHREMPIKADYVPFVINTNRTEMVEVTFTGDEPLVEIVLIHP